jgi:hypothetical protein
MVVIAGTANHWWLDSIAAAAVLGVALAAQWAIARVRARNRVAVPVQAEPVDVTEPSLGPDALEPAPAPA